MRLATLRRTRHDPRCPACTAPPGSSAAPAPWPGGAKPGDIAVIDHLDLDGAQRAAAGRRPASAAVVNAAPEHQRPLPEPRARAAGRGRHPAARRGRPRGDAAGGRRREAAPGRRHALPRRASRSCHGALLTPQSVATAMETARADLGAQLRGLRRTPRPSTCAASGTCCWTAPACPGCGTPLAGRPVVVVTRGRGSEQDLRSLRSWLRTTDPVLVGVDEGADALLAAGLRPHLVVGDPRLMSEEVLELRRRARGPRRPGRQRARPGPRGAVRRRAGDLPDAGGPARTPRCCSSTRTTRRWSSGSAGTPPWPRWWTPAAPTCRAPS